MVRLIFLSLVIFSAFFILTTKEGYAGHGIYSKGKCYKKVGSTFKKPAVIICSNGSKLEGILMAGEDGVAYVRVGNKGYRDRDARKFCGCR